MDYDTTSLANGVQAGLAQQAKLYQNGKIADSFVKVNPEALAALGMSPEAFGSLSASDRSSAVTGYISAQAQKGQNQLLEARKADLLAQAQQRQDAAAEDQAVGASTARFVSAPQNPQSVVTPQMLAGFMPQGPQRDATLAITPDQLRQAGVNVPSIADRMNNALLTPGMGGKTLAPVIKNLTLLKTLYSGAGDGKTPVDTYDFPNGLKGYSLRGSKEVHWVDAQGTTLEAEPIYDAVTGEDTGQKGMRGANGKLIMLKPTNTASAAKMAAHTANELDTKIGKIDDDIEAWNTSLKNYQANPDDPKNYPQPDPAKLKVLKQRRAMISQYMQPALAAAPAAGGGSGGGAPIGAGATVKVQHPNGKIGFIPSSQLSDALKSGYKQVQ